MFLADDVLVYSASDLSTAFACEFQLLRKLDEKLGRVPKLETSDPMLERAARLGAEHEALVLADYRDRFGAGVVEIDPPTEYTAHALRQQQVQTVAALRDGADVVVQGSFFDGRFHGRSDFLVREGDVDGRPRYAVVDTKLARSAKPKAILQLAAYADQLQRLGIPLAEHTRLHLGNGAITEHETAASVAVHREHRRHVQTLLDGHRADDGPVPWGDERFMACLWCEHCKAEIARTRDVQLVWGIRRQHREALRRAGLATIDALAMATRPVEGVRPEMWQRLQAQARLQLKQEQVIADGAGQVLSEAHDRTGLDELPAPDAGDVFFDFEGDPLWVDADRTVWGLEYLFGLMEVDGAYVTFWAHDRAAEGVALRKFLDYLRQRRARHPGMHVYHFAGYEQYTLRNLAERHGGVEEVTELLDSGLFVDLYRTVKSSVRVGQASYSLKKLEPLYMGAEQRSGVTTGGDSVVAYEDACAMRDRGDETGYRARLDELADYNRYDCLSTRQLRDWLLAQRDALGPDEAVTPSEPGERAAAETATGETVAAEPVESAVRGLSDATAMHDHAAGPLHHLAGIAAGLHLVSVPHRGNSRVSSEESAEIVAQVTSLLGRQLVDGEQTRPLVAADLLVLAADAEQARRIGLDLRAADITGVRVGTVHELQGQRAAVVIGSLAASTPEDVRRDLRFVLAPDRWGAAVAAARWATILVRSPTLTRRLPADPTDLATLGSFLELCTGARERRPRSR
ncbi:TM0106 family RecB-like putative nuclease [Ruania alba]|uniref:RecB family nuclease, putative, TM0106 family n=1 Tax=Ruania alba TaxID=648782 RepID=A0A1H5M7I2_9MICO|nr:TM0106 family RecB-like putative nuclease [Ruania alba]SEE85262.1 RecB family nuclease, putative, TM0106 family [Ruania alba]